MFVKLGTATEITQTFGPVNMLDNAFIPAKFNL
jgi:hypothetical protein